MRKIKKILLFVSVTAVLMLVFVFWASAMTETGQCGDNVYWSYDSLTKELLISGSGDMWDYDKDKVVGSSDDTPFYQGGFSKVVIGKGVTSVGERAFAWSSAQAIEISDSVTKIGDYAFSWCGFSNITIPDSVTEIGNGAFSWCGDLKMIILPKTISKMGDSIFSFCGFLEKVVLPEGLTEIGTSMFYCCGADSIVIPVSVKKISARAFEDAGVKEIYFMGSEEKWNQIEIEDRNDNLKHATFHFNHKHVDLIIDGFCDDCTAKVGAAHTHTYTSSVTKSATCIVNGIKIFTCTCGDTYTEAIKATGKHTGGTATCKEKAKCSVCKQSYGILKAHTYKTAITKATLKKIGKTVTKCTTCGYASKTSIIYYPNSIKLSATTYTYNGKTKTPTVTVKDSKGNTLKKGADYTVTYPKKRKAIGKYTVTVTFKGKYSGSKKLTFEIVPAKVTLSKISAGKKQLTAAWKTVSGATGYEVQYSTSKKFTKKTTKTVTIKKGKTTKTTLKKLKSGKKYYVRVKAYKTVSKKAVYGNYSSVKSVTVK